MLISKFDNNNVSEEVEKIEKTYNIIIPEQYKNFLLTYNGGKTPETEFKVNGVNSDIQGFYGLGKAKKNFHFDSIKGLYKMEEWLEDKMFPIASNTFGDYILISIDDEKRGGIFFHYHDRAKNYIKLADDFTSFVGKCKSKKLGHIRTMEERKEDMKKLGKYHKITPEKIAGWQAEIDEYADVHQEELVL